MYFEKIVNIIKLEKILFSDVIEVSKIIGVILGVVSFIFFVFVFVWILL